MSLVKRKQIDLYIKPAPTSNWSNLLQGVANGTYEIQTGDQYETVIFNLANAIDEVFGSISGNGYTFTYDGGGSIVLDLGGTIDISGTTNQLVVNLTSGGAGSLGYTLSLADTLIAPGTLEVTDDATFQADVQINGNLTVVGDVTQTQVNDLVVSDRFIKIADGNTGSLDITGIYQQTGSSSFAGLLYDNDNSEFVLFTSGAEPDTSTNTSTLTKAKIDFGSFGTNALEALQDEVAAMVTTQNGLVTVNYNDVDGTIGLDIDIASLLPNLEFDVIGEFTLSSFQTESVNFNLSTGITFTESNTAFVRQNAAGNGMKVVVKGLIHEDITYAASPAAGNFTVSNGDATIKLGHPIATNEFYDSIKNNKELIQAFINGVKCKLSEFTYSSGSDLVQIGASAIGFSIDAFDTITVLYYGQ